ncbi:MAG: hypothetical protein E7575_00595 [Ruminococcaceae bacterium]|nr:hypothetical protein [Oscillospiraceae bacterium]
MKRLIKGAVRKALSLLPVKNAVMFESAPDLSDNTRAVFDEMLRRGMNEKYKLIWLIKGEAPADLASLKNVKFIKYGSKRLPLVKRMTKCFICCNDWLSTLRQGQTSFYLSHGTTIKKLKGYYTVPEEMDYCLAASVGVVELCEREFEVARRKIFALGFPRNDVLTNEDRDLKELFPDCDFEKAVVWYPTYRQHSNGNVVGKGNPLPIIHDSEKAKELNAYAAENRVLIVLKPHFAQDISYMKSEPLSNIRFIDDSFFAKNAITSYEFVGSCSALITDYSSIYYDYTLCDRPIALVWEDYEDYKENPGFADGVEEFLEGGEKVYDLSDFKEFIGRVSRGEDAMREKRNAVCSAVNYSKDGENSKRVVDFIIEKAGL